MKKTFVKVLASVLVVLTILSATSLVGMAFDPIEAEQATVSSLLGDTFCFRKPDKGTDTDVDVEYGTDTDVDFGTDTDVDCGTGTDAEEEIPSTDAARDNCFTRIWKFIRNLFSFKWLF